MAIIMWWKHTHWSKLVRTNYTATSRLSSDRYFDTTVITIFKTCILNQKNSGPKNLKKTIDNFPVGSSFDYTNSHDTGSYNTLVW